jgi:hypothetical protein
MTFTIDPTDHTITLVVDKDELASINDALGERVHLSVMADGKPVRGFLGRADEELARQLECATYSAYCQLEDRLCEAKAPATGRSEAGDMLFNMLCDFNKAYAKAVR